VSGHEGIIPLPDATDPARFGGKATSLGEALRVALPVPSGFALSVDVVDAVARNDERARARVRAVVAEIGEAVAARSSAIGEDGASASFAGQHLTVLNVHRGDAAVEAITRIWSSARAPAALAYRTKLGLAGDPQIAVVLQRMVVPRTAGVLFTRDPMTGEDVRVIEGSWGLGEVVVAGMVTPDHFRIDRAGRILERRAGDKDIELRGLPEGGTEEIAVDPDRAERLCLDDGHLLRLHALASRCEDVSQGPHDLEWAFTAKDELFLLQRRPITR
jgi:pyruvate,water dikinase